MSSIFTTGTPLVKSFTVDGSRRVKTATSSQSEFCLIAHSTPFPRFPYPKIPIFIFSPKLD